MRLVHRLFAYLTMKKRAGYYHDLQIVTRDKNDLTVSCLMCPLPNVNIPADFEKEKRAPYVIIQCSIDAR